MRKYMLVALIVTMSGLVGMMDFNDELNSVEIYCQNVKDGVWPDYEATYRKECKDGHAIRR